ncbi:MAG: ferredoxin family protein [Chloroflexi bacterium]|nr:ferredoxin family protein [Chloroflexota bacterium]MDA8186740.1 mercury methylation ferredoxin HgcB [Dehalococcoidales bacterium]
MTSATAINTLKYTPETCINCGMCIAVCPHGVFAPNGRAVKPVRSDACMECGACQRNCPTDAISVDSGVGCAGAMIRAALTGQKEPTCGSGGGESSSCCEG